jgi:hypothetical protein
LRSNSDLEVEKIKRNGIADFAQELEHQRSFVRNPRIVTIPFEFGSDRHYGIKRDMRSLDRREGEKGPSNEGKAEVKSQPLDLIEGRLMVGNHCGDQEEN